MQKNIVQRFLSAIFDPLDAWILTLLLILWVMSSFVLYSADGGNLDRLENKMIYTCLGLFIMWVLAAIRYQTAMLAALPLYLISMVLLVFVHFKGLTINGSTRWLDLGVFRIQPSEMMRLVLPMVVAWYYHYYEHELRWPHYLVTIVLVLLPSALILKQPDLGTTLMVAWPALIIIFAAGISWRFIGLIALVGALSIYPIWHFGLHDYQRTRILSALDPSSDPRGAGYHVLQAQTAIGAGGLTGVGYLDGSQTRLKFVPEQATDFILAPFSEEFGFMGNVGLLFIYFLLVIRGFHIAANTEHLYARLMACALTMSFVAYFFVNMGMVIGLLPVVGVPLPFMSYGGTASIILFASMGMLMSFRQKKY